MHVHVVVGGFDPIDLRGFDEGHFPGGFDREPPRVFRLRLELVDELQKLRARFGPWALRELSLDALQSRLQTLAIEGFQQVV